MLDAHGWGELHPELNALSKQGRWQDMASLIDDEMLHTVAACGSPSAIAAQIRDRVRGGPIGCACISPARSRSIRWPRSLTHSVPEVLLWMVRSRTKGGSHGGHGT